MSGGTRKMIRDSLRKGIKAAKRARPAGQKGRVDFAAAFRMMKTEMAAKNKSNLIQE